MSAYETEEFSWSLTVSHYNIDLGRTKIETLEFGNNFKDVQGNDLMRFFGSGGGYGIGIRPMGGTPRSMRLPKTLQLSYYDYQEDRFYQLNAELPQQKIYELFKQKIIDTDMVEGAIIPRFNAFKIGIAPRGYVMLWINAADGLNQIELEPLRAQPMEDMTVQKYNSTGNYDPVNGGRAFPLNPDRWEMLTDSGTYRTALKPETVKRLQAGWTPEPDYYMSQRVKYPWRFRMVGNARLHAFKATYGNQEHASVQAWEISQYATQAMLRGIPESATFWFDDAAGKRHSLYMGFFSKDRVNGEPDLMPIWRAYIQVFPQRKVMDNAQWPSEEEMATVEIGVSDDLQTYTATLVKGTQRVPLPIGKTQFFDLEPHAYWPGSKTPKPEVLWRLQNGPYAVK